MTDFSRIRPGWRVGPTHDPDEYRLVRRVTSGGEGELWLAAQRDPGSPKERHWALKILIPSRISPQDPAGALTKLRVSRREVNHLQLNGLLIPYDEFEGPAPHPQGEPFSERGLYQISRWLDGTDLRSWTGGPNEAVVVIVELCRIVDQLHDRGYLHRDISPANVMVGADGSVTLIDITFIRDVDLGVRTRIGTPGSAAPEWRSGSTFATDRYSVGAVAYRILTGDHALPQLGAAEHARRAL
ncbi:protein kinase, partial [Streptosporangium algeriense]